MKRYLPIILLAALSGCVNAGKVTDATDAVKGAADATSSALGVLKKIITFPLDVVMPTAEAAPAPEVKQEVPGGLPTWLGSTIGGLVAGFLAGRLRKKEPAAPTPPEVKP